MKLKSFDIVVLGAGASGLVCAATAARRGRSVLLIDHADKPGRKLAVTGGGKCNFSNRHIGPEHYFGENPDFCRSALAGFSTEELLEKLAAAGLAVEERDHGQLFLTRSAKDLVNLLRDECEQSGCAFAFGEKILSLAALPPAAAPEARPDTAPAAADLPPQFEVTVTSGTMAARSVAIALGGPAWPQVGATGKGHELAKALGHRIVPVRPALAGLVMSADWPLAGLAGISVTADVRLLGPLKASAAAPRATGGKQRGKGAPLQPDPAAANLALLFTHKGLSGPAALQASLYWRKGDALLVNFLPGLDIETLLAAPGAGKMLCRTLVKRHLPDRLCEALLPRPIADKRCAELATAEREALRKALTEHCVRPTGSEGFAKAEVAAGGVSTDEISSKSMESRLVPGLYFCGEVLDVTGRLGGYNLHWAFASGRAAGKNA